MILGKIYPKRKDVPTANLRRFGDDIMGITCHIRRNYGENSLSPAILSTKGGSSTIQPLSVLFSLTELTLMRTPSLALLETSQILLYSLHLSQLVSQPCLTLAHMLVMTVMMRMKMRTMCHIRWEIIKVMLHHMLRN